MQLKKRVSRLFPALLSAFSVAFPYCIAGPLDIWVGNRTEFLFSVGDFIGWMVLILLGLCLMLTAILMLVPDRVYPILFGVFSWFGIMSCIQGLFLNYGTHALAGDDGGGQTAPLWFVILDVILWVAAGIGCVVGALKMRKKEMVRMVAMILLVTVCGMQLIGCLSLIPEAVSTGRPGESGEATESTISSETGTETIEPTAPVKMYLTRGGLNTVAPGKNIVIFVLDRFDISHYYEMLEYDQSAFSFLTGFTAYPDNISLYSRTYPAVASMISGMRNDFSGSAEEYFAAAYGKSEFLRTLKQNDYAVRIYTTDYYGYRDASVLAGIANNLNDSGGYSVTDCGRLIGGMLALSAYRYLPTVIKPLISVSTTSFSGIGIYGDAPAYEMNDAAVFQTVSEGLSVDSSCGQNAYTFIHLNGCHPPYKMDEKGHAASSTALRSTRGCFWLIEMYLNEMKRLGVYEDATVVITGDHPWAVDDYVEPTQPRLTALFVKEAGAAEEPFRVSGAQVSQENLIPTLVKSADLRTDRVWGRAYSEIPENENTERHHLFELTYEDGSSALVDFRINGRGEDFSNWSVNGRTDIGWLYK